MNFKEILEKILEFDQDIRFAAVFDRFGTIKEKVQRDNTSLVLSEFETQNMLREAASSWFHRKNLKKILGNGHYSMTVYDKLVRITLPLNSDHFIIISHTNVTDPPAIIKHTQQVLNSNDIDLQ